MVPSFISSIIIRKDDPVLINGFSLSDLRDDKHYFIEHPGAVPISTAQVTFPQLKFLQVSFAYPLSVFVTCVKGEELKKTVGASAYIECSAKTQQVPQTHYLRIVF